MLLRGAIRSNIYFGNFSDAIYYSEKLNKFKKVEENGTVTSLLTLTNKIKNAEYNQAKKRLEEILDSDTQLKKKRKVWLRLHLLL